MKQSASGHTPVSCNTPPAAGARCSRELHGRLHERHFPGTVQKSFKCTREQNDLRGASAARRSAPTQHAAVWPATDVKRRADPLATVSCMPEREPLDYPSKLVVFSHTAAPSFAGFPHIFPLPPSSPSIPPSLTPSLLRKATVPGSDLPSDPQRLSQKRAFSRTCF